MLKLIIRPYQSSDYIGCMSLFDSNCPAFFADHEKIEFQALLKNIGKATGEGSIFYYVAEHEDQISACAGFHLPTDQAEPAGLVWGMVGRKFQRRGIGKELLNFRLTKIQQLRPGVSVILDTTQLSFAFFEKAGFHTQRIIKDFYAPSLDRYDMILHL